MSFSPSVLHSCSIAVIGVRQYILHVLLALVNICDAKLKKPLQGARNEIENFEFYISNDVFAAHKCVRKHVPVGGSS